MKLVQSWVVGAACWVVVGCVETELSEAPDPRAPQQHVADVVDDAAAVLASEGRFVPFARVEGYGNPKTGELWMRQLPLRAGSELDERGVARASQSLAGFCELDAESDGQLGTNRAGTFEFYTKGDVTEVEAEDSSFDIAECYARLPPNLQDSMHTTLFNQVGVGCALQHVGNFTGTNFNRVLLDFDVFNGNEAAHSPYGFPYTTGTVPTPIGQRNAPQAQRGLWSFGSFTGSESKEMWIYFKNDDETDFNFTGYLLGEVLETCGNSSDDDCDGAVDNNCGTRALGEGCYADADCVTGNCAGEMIVSRLGEGGVPATSDVPGMCAPRCGDGVVQGNEVCDDNNGMSGDGCSSLCRRECPRGQTGQNNCFAPTQIASGTQHACAITDIGTVKCWGEPPGTGAPSRALATDAPHLQLGGDAAQLSAGPMGSCIVFQDGTLRCWGDNAHLQARGAIGANVTVGSGSAPPPALDVGGSVAQVVLGQNHTCVLRQSGAVRCWGKNTEGQCGLGNVTSPRALSGGSDVTLAGPAKQICAGGNHSCALLDDGQVHCWGANNAGQLGYGHMNTIGDDEGVMSVGPVPILNSSEIAAGRWVETIACGGNASCAILDNGALRCWGSNVEGELGYGHTNNIGDDELPFTAGSVSVGGPVKQVTTGDFVTCALLDSNAVKCWGWTGRHPGGCLGHGGSCGTQVSSPPASTIAVDPVAAEPVLELGTRSESSTLCALLGGGGIKCWSGNPLNACGLNTATNPIDPPSTTFTLPADDAGEACTIDSDCVPGNVCESSSVCVHQGVLRIALSWTAGTDFDLHVLTPGLQELNPVMERGGGGLLDVEDTGAGAGTHVEHAAFFFAQTGTFEFWVRNVTGDIGGSFTLRVYENGVQQAIHSGTLGAMGSMDSAHFTFVYPTPVPPIVLGQTDYTGNLVGTGAASMDSPAAVAVDPTSGKIFVADTSNNRVLRFASYPELSNGASAEAVLGQSTFLGNTASFSANGMSFPSGVFVDAGGRLWVADSANHRVLRFDNAASASNGAGAAGVLGQIGFSNNSSGNASNRFNVPIGVYVDGDGRLWVADSANCRVSRFENAASKTNGASADGELGQMGFLTPNCVAAANRMNQPRGVFADNAGRLWVADNGNHRVLRFENAAAKANGAAADGVLGQLSFTGNTSSLSQSGMDGPTGLTGDDGYLAVSDRNNNRIIGFEMADTLTNGANAAEVLVGQPDYTSNTPATSEQGLSGPSRIFYDRVNNVLWIADTSNHRVMGYNVQ